MYPNWIIQFRGYQYDTIIDISASLSTVAVDHMLSYNSDHHQDNPKFLHLCRNPTTLPNVLSIMPFRQTWRSLCHITAGRLFPKSHQAGLSVTSCHMSTQSWLERPTTHNAHDASRGKCQVPALILTNKVTGSLLTAKTPAPFVFCHLSSLGTMISTHTPS